MGDSLPRHQKLKIAFFLENIDATAGGAKTFQDAILHGLQQINSNRIEIFFVCDQPALPESERILNLAHIRGYNDSALGDLDYLIAKNSIDLVWFLTPHVRHIMIPYIVTVWDLEHRKHGFFPEIGVVGWRIEDREKHFSHVISKAIFTIVGSEEGKREISRYYHVPADRIHVIPFPVPVWTASAKPIRPASLHERVSPGKYLFYPAQFWSHKNHVRLIETLASLQKGGKNIQLVLCGSDKGNQEAINTMARESQIADSISMLNFVSFDELAWLYKNAAALVFPTYFGPDNLPPLEALFFGCPIIVSDIAGAREVYGNAALYFDPASSTSLATQLKKLKKVAPRLKRNRTALLNRHSLHNYIAAISRTIDFFNPLASTWGIGNYLSLYRSTIWVGNKNEINWDKPSASVSCNLISGNFNLTWSISQVLNLFGQSILWQPMPVAGYQVKMDRISLRLANGKKIRIPVFLTRVRGKFIRNKMVTSTADNIIVEIKLPGFVRGDFELTIAGTWQLSSKNSTGAANSVGVGSRNRIKRLILSTFNTASNMIIKLCSLR